MGQALGRRDLVDGSHGHRLDRHSGPGGRPSGPHCRRAAAAFPPSSNYYSPGSPPWAQPCTWSSPQPPSWSSSSRPALVPADRNRYAASPKAVYTLFIGEVTAFIAAGAAKMGGNLVIAQGIS